MDGKTLVNVMKVNFIDEITNIKHTIETSDEIDIDPIKSDGKRDILRVKNKIYGINETEDIVIGYKLKLKDNLFNIQTMALIDGGTIEGNKYCGTEAGVTVERHPFTMEIITEEKDYSRTIGYAKFVYKHCKGKPAKYKVKDGAFMVPEYEAESIPFRGEKPVEIEFIKGIDEETPISDIGVDGGKVEDTNTDVGVEITNRVIWTFKEAINQDEVTKTNFSVKRKSDNSIIDGNVTIDTTKKIVTFIPTSLSVDTTYIAEAKAVNKLDASGTTTALSTEFKAIKIK
ncbi:Ig-like domain-containing protein [Clostridium algidicarnis]|uniref:Ig-like domain-containing protein n=2 Tax=Clostridium algidicarnis TaxID=37659 RepID=UPI001C0CA2DA|nr:Ig-like domain-containing protein [Clostridium algidicarnis]MBU3205128.1 Ig-like domain-containing protein [Clostridium algidicarnis]MBU3213281.1 Ig-like domain-containing protein [Clostridium algidicarnis]MBU3223824.1 Ig-like domain-containing protein [Clostridium algidicarnis]